MTANLKGVVDREMRMTVYIRWVNFPEQDKVKRREEQVNKMSENKPMFITKRNQKNKYQDE